MERISRHTGDGLRDLQNKIEKQRTKKNLQSKVAVCSYEVTVCSSNIMRPALQTVYRLETIYERIVQGHGQTPVHHLTSH